MTKNHSKWVQQVSLLDHISMIRHDLQSWNSKFSGLDLLETSLLYSVFASKITFLGYFGTEHFTSNKPPFWKISCPPRHLLRMIWYSLLALDTLWNHETERNWMLYLSWNFCCYEVRHNVERFWHNLKYNDCSWRKTLWIYFKYIVTYR